MSLIGVAQAAQNVTFADDFSSGGYSGSSGTAPWASPWVEQGDDGSASGGTFQVRTDVDCSGPCLWVDGNPEKKNRLVMRTADLEGATDATLTFSYRRVSESGDDGEGDVEIGVASQGGSWAKLLKIKLDKIDADTQWVSISISDKISPGTSIRFKRKGKSGDIDLLIDNVRIEATYSGTTTTTTTSTTTTSTTTTSTTIPSTTTTTTTTTTIPSTTTTTTTTTTIPSTTTTTTSTTIPSTSTTIPPGIGDTEVGEPPTTFPSNTDPAPDLSTVERYIEKDDLVAVTFSAPAGASGGDSPDFGVAPTTSLGAVMQSAARTLRTNMVAGAILGIFVAVVGIRGFANEDDLVDEDPSRRP